MTTKKKFDMRRFGAALTAILLLAMTLVMPITAFAAGELPKVNDARKGVVRIVAYDENGVSLSSGSAFGIGQAGQITDIFVTNKHVVSDESGNILDHVYILMNNDAIEYQYITDADGNTVKYFNKIDTAQMIRCIVIDSKDFPDIAILKADKPVDDHVALKLSESKKLEPTDPVYALGFPADADISSVSINSIGHYSCGIGDVVVTDGTVSKTELFGPAENTNVVHHTANINNGNSGGPIVNKNGDVVGINTYGYGTYSYAIFTEYAKDMLDANHIPYDTDEFPLWLLIVIIAAAVVLIGVIVLVLVLVLTKKNKAPQAGGDDVVTMVDDSPKNDFRLQSISGTFGSRRFALENRTVLGCDPAKCQLVYPQGTKGVSHVHCELQFNNGNMYLTDLGSSYGTYLNGGKINPHTKIQLKIGDVIAIGSNNECLRLDVTFH